jgi:signal transduction histidine kinase
MPAALSRRFSGLFPSEISRRTRDMLARGAAPLPSPIRFFGGLRIRPKFMVLHNLFFLALGLAIYFALVPLIEERISAAREHEIAVVSQALGGGRMTPGELYQYRTGGVAQLQIPTEAVKFLEENPGRVYRDRLTLFHLEKGRYGRADIPSSFYDGFLWRVQWTLFAVLAGAYLLAILLLEGFIMPKFVFTPIRSFLAADEAVRRGDRREELIEDDVILNDEIGQIMRSRNATVSALRNHEDELGAALAQLEAQDRLASLGLLSASVAHELNTPLAVLQGSLERIAEQPSIPASHERIDRMLRVTQRIRKISESLIDFARVRRDVMEPVRIRPLIEEAWELLAIEDKAASARFDNRVPEIDTVIGNGDRLIQVFVNLLRNALEAIRAGGAIHVSSHECIEAGRRMLAIRFADNGPGIPAEVLPALFDAFVSTRLDSRGTGLGLMIAEGIIRQHGGAISAANRPEGGAVIEVRLPAT